MTRVHLTELANRRRRIVSAARVRFGVGRTSAADILIPAAERVAPITRWIRTRTRIVTGLGWTVLAAAISSWLVATQLGWVEISFLAAAALVLFALCIGFTLGHMGLVVTVDADPRRISAGQPAMCRVNIHSASRKRLLPFVLELPVGAAETRFDVPSLAPAGGHEEIFLVPTSQRGVIPIGPAMSVRGDPIGLLRRAAIWTGVTEIFVHPVTVPLESLGAGLLRDLEGQATNDLSSNDLSFHALREYVPGDEMRHIHWRSSAKLSAGQQDRAPARAPIPRHAPIAPGDRCRWAIRELPGS